MKKIYYIILLFFTLVGLWIIPSLVKKSTITPDDYPFVYYSSLMEDFAIFDYSNKEKPMSDLKGNYYTTEQSDSLLPLFSYRQLMSDGKLPDSLAGYELTPQLIRSKSVVFRYSPRSIKTPTIDLHFLFESMPKRVGLEVPSDVFRLTDCIEFIDDDSNEINQEKSLVFQKELNKRGFTFPAQWSSGNPNPRKAYDEGYFSLDADGKLFHIKMVNGRPFVRDTKIGEDIDITYFSMLEVSDKRFYGFLFDTSGFVYILESIDGGYQSLKLDIDPLDLDKDQMIIMGNLLYWTISVTTEEGRRYFALKTENLEQVSSHFIPREKNKWDKTSSYLFPYYLTFDSSYSDYLSARIHVTGVFGFITNIFLAVVTFVVSRRNRYNTLFNTLFVALTGIAGFVALLLLPNFIKKQ
ncbi:DUF4857 domain-containing protein [Bacteroidales bacterium OttesenSCG-928-M11]|nr:DUF4857 domain-containing protein [Bacteroidales bacterium OttesenSCG-928-M11]